MGITDHVKAAFILLVGIGLLGAFVNFVPPKIGAAICGAVALVVSYRMILLIMRRPR